MPRTLGPRMLARDADGVVRARRRTGSTRARLVIAALALTAALTMAMAANASATSYSAEGWGLNVTGQLGDGLETGPERCGFAESDCSTKPVAVSGLSEVTQIAAGGVASIALLANGTVMGWGENIEAGDGEYGGKTTVPVPVCAAGSEGPCPSGPYLSGVTAISAGEGFSMALLSNGTVVTWGVNGTGELGDGNPEARPNPTPVCSVGTEFNNEKFCPKGILKEVAAISAGDDHALALLTNGTVVAWGEDNDGQVGEGTFEPSPYAPVHVIDLSGVSAIAAGGFHSLALLGNGTVMSWGDNADGQLGDGTSTGPSTCGGAGCSATPMVVSGLSGVTAISGGFEDSLALLSTGKVMSWGDNQEGSLGDGTFSGPENCERACSTKPEEVSGLSGVTAIGGSAEDGMALLNNHTVMSWGWNEDGQLGDGTITNSDVPVHVPICALSEVTGISRGNGSDNSYAIGVASNPCEAPEFGRCVKVAKGAGKYASSSCTSLGGTDGYEWDSGVVERHFTTAIKSASLTLETVKGSKVTCTGETSTGEYTGLKTVGGVVLTLTGCERSSEKCASGMVAGEIVSRSLEGVLGVEKLGASSSKNKIGLDLYSVGKTGALLEFSCGSTTASVQGSVIVPVKADKMSLTQTLKFKATKGKQKPESFVGDPKDILEASFDAAPFEQTGLTLSATQFNKESVEVNSVV
jgi:alpha-tubulin suppressor-like RCC1 family protein